MSTLKSLLDTADCERAKMSDFQIRLFTLMTLTEERIPGEKSREFSLDLFDERQEVKKKLPIPDPSAFMDAPMRFGAEILETRFKGFVPGGLVPCSNSLGMYIVMSTKMHPGNIVQWAYALWRLFQKKGKLVTLETFAHAFPYGVPTEAALLKYWDNQKVLTGPSRGANRLDDPAEWK